MHWIFQECINLESINFGNIDTSSLKQMNGIIYNCLKLKSIDLSLLKLYIWMRCLEIA